MPGENDNAKWKREWEGKPLASHLSYHFLKTVIHRETPLHKCSVLAHICCLQLLQRNQSVKTQDARPRRQHLQCIYEWPENWAWGQIPCNSGAYLQLELGKTTRGRPLVHLLPCRDTCTTFFSMQPATRLQHIIWALPCVPFMLVVCWDIWDLKYNGGNKAMQMPLLACLPLPWTCMRSAPQWRSLQPLKSDSGKSQLLMSTYPWAKV